MHNGVTSHLWLKSALHASSHPCMCTCVLRLGCFLLACLVLYFVPPFSFQPFLMFTSEFNERSRSNPLCDFRLGTVVTSDYETPLTGEKCSFAHRQVDEQPTKRSKTNNDKSAVAMLKKGNWQEREFVSDACHDRTGQLVKRSEKKLRQNYLNVDFLMHDNGVAYFRT